MKTAITIAFDSAGSPTLLADTRTSAEIQRKQFVMIKHGGESPPVEATRIELWESDLGCVNTWQAPNQTVKTDKKKSK